MPQFTGKEFSQIAGSISALLGARLDVYAAFKIRKFAKAAMEELRELEETRLKLIKQYGEIMPDGENFKVSPERKEQFDAEWEKILSEEIVLPNVEPPIKVRDLEKANMSVIDIVNLDFLLDQDDGDRVAKIKLLDQVQAEAHK